MDNEDLTIATVFADDNKKYITTKLSDEIDDNPKLYSNNIKLIGTDSQIDIFQGDAMEILPTFNKQYDVIYIDANKGKYPIYLQHAIRLSKVGTVILADNILYKGYVLGDYNKHKQRTAVKHLREYIAETMSNERLETEILKIGDGLSITRVIK